MNKYNESKNALNKSWEDFKKAWKSLWIATGWTLKTILNTTKWLHNLIDSWDLAIHSKLWKSSNKVVDFTKKNILKILIASSILTYSWNKIYENQKDKKLMDTEISNDKGNNTIDLKTIEYKIKTPDALQWKKIWDLYSHYLWYNWVSSQIWDTITFKPNKILSELYWRKFNRDNDKWFTVAKDFYENTVNKIDFDIVTPSSLELMKWNIKSSIEDVNKNFGREKFWKEKLKWNSEKIKLFKNICETIDEKCLLAYGMTELMPSKEWNLNKEILDFMLKNWWENFVMNLPAVADDYTSFGLYQFTSFAVYDTWNQQEWASIMNWYIPKELKIPGSVTKLNWNDHHKAAYLFAMYNLYNLVFKADWENVKALNLLISQSDNNDLSQLIAIMHNLPSSGQKFLSERYKLKTDKNYLNKKTHDKKWNKNYEHDINDNWKIDLYESLLTPTASHKYWEKTYYNRVVQ